MASSKRSSTKEKLTRALKKMGAVRRQSVILKSGKVSDIYIDIKAAFGDPHILGLMARAVSVMIDRRVSCIACSGYGGLPLGTAVALHMRLPLTLVREKPKKHGRAVWLDGYLPTPADRVALVDDVYTTGLSLRQMERVLKHGRARIVGRYVVVDRSTNSKKVKSLLKLSDLF